ncbi:hypothetical protein [Daejeonella sp.]|uniref:hypothetical protein n=1 Tax=Daejeonella sp. TaxID=2805397 RepID=UPI0025BDF6D3|nr:hypothetical protein [Daejeonella sp.]
MDKTNYLELFNREFLTTLSDWQKGWGEDQNIRRQLADKLVGACENLPAEFKVCKQECFRKRFIVGGEIVPIIINDDFFEGIASWTLNIDCAKTFKKLLKQNTKFAMIFKQRPKKGDVIVNICELWKNESFIKSVDELNKKDPQIAYPLLNFRDYQSEVILRTNLKGSEIEHIVGVSSSFDEICDMGNIPQEEREELSKRYAKDPNGIPISFPTYATSEGTKEAVKNTIKDIKNRIDHGRRDNIPINGLIFNPHPEDLKHRIN